MIDIKAGLKKYPRILFGMAVVLIFYGTFLHFTKSRGHDLFTWLGIMLMLVQVYLSATSPKQRKSLVILGLVSFLAMVAFWWWRNGVVVAQASFDPGIAPFTIEVRKVPVPVTDSSHFIISLFRGQYVVPRFVISGLHTPQGR